MAITASITLTSGANDLVTDALALATESSLTKATTTVAIANTTGLARKTTASTDQYTLLYADDFTADKAHKLYMKNTSTVAAEFFTVHIDDEKLGLMYAGDWALIPWAASSGTREVFTVSLSGTWAAADTLTFDGVTVNANTAHATTATILRATIYPNWTVSGTGSNAIFTAKIARADQEIDASEWTLVDLADSNATFAVATVTEGLDNASNIKITPSVATTMKLEHALLYEL